MTHPSRLAEAEAEAILRRAGLDGWALHGGLVSGTAQLLEHLRASGWRSPGLARAAVGEEPSADQHPPQWAASQTRAS